MIPLTTRRFKVCIDPGHGGFDPGAVGLSGAQEKVVTLAVAKQVASILRGVGVDVVLTRESDELLAGTINADLGMRYDKANWAKADVFVSIHCNSAADPKANGTETFHYTGSPAGKKLAGHIQARMVAALGLRDRGVKQANFAVLRGTNMPAALAEIAFISNPDEEKLLESPAFQVKAARAIAEGIADYLGVALKDDTPKVRIGKKELNGINVDGITYAPVRAMAEALGCKVTWDSITRMVVVE